MFWAGFRKNIRTLLIILEGDLIAANNRVSINTIYNLYRQVIPELIDDTDIFIYNNTLVHRAYLIRDLLRDIHKELGFKIIVQPPYSPNLNLIKNLQAILKREIYRLYLDLKHIANNLDTKEQLI